jgi:hypothetical protein
MADGMGDSGFSSDPSMGSFKTSNSISAKLPAGDGSSTMRPGANLEQKAGNYSMRHSTKGLSSGPKPFTVKVKPMKNIGRDIGRKRGF